MEGEDCKPVIQVYTCLSGRKTGKVKKQKETSASPKPNQDQKDESTGTKEVKEEKEDAKIIVKTAVERKPVQRPKPQKHLKSQEPLALEINQLKIRFSDLTPVSNSLPDHKSFQMTIPINDPEFPYDLEDVILRIDVPKGYPKNETPMFELLNDNVPENLKKQFKNHMDKASKTLLGQEALRPMIRFLERNLELMLTPPKVTGFKFIPPPSSPNKEPQTENSITKTEDKTLPKAEILEEIEDMPEEFFEALKLLDVKLSSNESVKSSKSPLSENFQSLPLKKEAGSRFGLGMFVKTEPINLSSMMGFIQIQFHDLRMRNTGLMIITQLGIVMKCDRCRHGTSIEDLRPEVDRIYNCKKCGHKAELFFKADMIHETSKSAGFIRCKSAAPLEFLPSTIQVTCGSCLPDDPLASTVRIEGVQIGESVHFQCDYCHEGLSIQIGRVDWNHLENPLASKAVKRGAIPKLPSQIGEPLPDRGTCKHYKKSFRWFRFPCCGKAYPCDICHNEDASNGGHKAEWATRHICGLCSREFSVSQKECPCGAEPANTRKSAHWEGGKGMRDQNLMSRKDNKKYRNLTKPKPASK